MAAQLLAILLLPLAASALPTTITDLSMDSTEVTLSKPLLYGTHFTQHSLINVGRNGFLAFHSISVEFSNASRLVEYTGIVAPLWTDLSQVSSEHSSITVRDINSTALKVAVNQRMNPAQAFLPTGAVEINWVVASATNSSLINNFSVTIASDQCQTFAEFRYNAVFFTGSPLAVIGASSQRHPLSGNFNESLLLEETLLFALTPGCDLNLRYRGTCHAPSEQRVDLRMHSVTSCPSRMAVAATLPWFLPFPRPSSEKCYQSTVQNATVAGAPLNYSSICCYDSRGHLITIGIAQPYVMEASTDETDLASCSKGSQYTRFFSKRVSPIETIAYPVRNQGYVFGNAHFGTFSGKTFDFLRAGKYHLLTLWHFYAQNKNLEFVGLFESLSGGDGTNYTRAYLHSIDIFTEASRSSYSKKGEYSISAGDDGLQVLYKRNLESEMVTTVNKTEDIRDGKEPNFRFVGDILVAQFPKANVTVSIQAVGTKLTMMAQAWVPKCSACPLKAMACAHGCLSGMLLLDTAYPKLDLGNFRDILNASGMSFLNKFESSSLPTVPQMRYTRAGLQATLSTRVQNLCQNSTACWNDATTGNLTLASITRDTDVLYALSSSLMMQPPPLLKLSVPVLEATFSNTSTVTVIATAANGLTIRNFSISSITGIPEADYSTSITSVGGTKSLRFNWTPSTRHPSNISIVFEAIDSQLRRSEIPLTVTLCSCLGGTCANSSKIPTKPFTLLQCSSCRNGYAGLLCDKDENACLLGSCPKHRTCIDKPIPQSDFDCSVCHPGFVQDENNPNYCMDINECRGKCNSTYDICRNTEGSFTCGCQLGYSLGNTSTGPCTVIDNYCPAKVLPQASVDVLGNGQAGTGLRVTCNSGYRLQGSRSYICNGSSVTSGQWQGNQQCVKTPSYCPLKRVANSVVSGYGTGTLDTVVGVACNLGFRLVGSDQHKCVAFNDTHGTWRGNQSCVAIGRYCPVKTVELATVSDRWNGAAGSNLTLNCNAGYSVSGNMAYTCQTHNRTQGRWTGDQKCVITQFYCAERVVAFATVAGYGNGTLNTTLSITCNRGYPLIGSAPLTCVAGDTSQGIWQGNQTCFAPTVPSTVGAGTGSPDGSTGASVGAIVGGAAGGAFILVALGIWVLYMRKSVSGKMALNSGKSVKSVRSMKSMKSVSSDGELEPESRKRVVSTTSVVSMDATSGLSEPRITLGAVMDEPTPAENNVLEGDEVYEHITAFTDDATSGAANDDTENIYDMTDCNSFQGQVAIDTGSPYAPDTEMVYNGADSLYSTYTCTAAITKPQDRSSRQSLSGSRSPNLSTALPVQEQQQQQMHHPHPPSPPPAQEPARKTTSRKMSIFSQAGYISPNELPQDDMNKPAGPAEMYTQTGYTSQAGLEDSVEETPMMMVDDETAAPAGRDQYARPLPKAPLATKSSEEEVEPLYDGIG